MRPYLEAGRLRLVEAGRCPLPSVRLIATPGHSPFHNAIELHSEGERMVVGGDAWLTRVSLNGEMKGFLYMQLSGARRE